MADQAIDTVLAEYGIGFVVGDKDVNVHLSEFKQALKSLVETMMAEVVGEDEKSATTKLKPLIRYIGDDDENIAVNAGMMRKVDVVNDSRNMLRADQRQRIPHIISKYFDGTK